MFIILEFPDKNCYLGGGVTGLWTLVTTSTGVFASLSTSVFPFLNSYLPNLKLERKWFKNAIVIIIPLKLIIIIIKIKGNLMKNASKISKYHLENSFLYTKNRGREIKGAASRHQKILPVKNQCWLSLPCSY